MQRVQGLTPPVPPPPPRPAEPAVPPLPPSSSSERDALSDEHATARLVATTKRVASAPRSRRKLRPERRGAGGEAEGSDSQFLSSGIGSPLAGKRDLEGRELQTTHSSQWTRARR